LASNPKLAIKFLFNLYYPAESCFFGRTYESDILKLDFLGDGKTIAFENPVLFFHLKVAQDAGVNMVIELVLFGTIQHFTSREGQRGHSETYQSGLVPIPCDERERWRTRQAQPQTRFIEATDWEILAVVRDIVVLRLRADRTIAMVREREVLGT
jgi:hypothetical protein